MGTKKRTANRTTSHRWARPSIQALAWKNFGNGEDLEEQNEDGDELDTQEASDIEIYGEADSDGGGCVDDEPSLGSLDGRLSQKRWDLSDREPWPICVDAEHDEAEHEGGIEDEPHDADTARHLLGPPDWHSLAVGGR